jgi:type I restriction enzyme, S subunit
MTDHLALQPYLNSAPPNWDQRRFRFVVQERGEKNSRSDKPLLSLSAAAGIQEREGDDGLGRQAPSEETIATYGVVHPGDLVVNPMWAIEGGLASSNLLGAVSPAYRIYTPGGRVDSRYLHYLVRSSPYIEQYKLSIRGVTTFDRSISKDDFNDLPTLLPPLDEQRRIADFLDAEAARIDSLTANRRTQISVLEELELARIGEHLSNARTAGPVYAYFDVQLGKMLNPERASGGNQQPYLRHANVHWYEVTTDDVATMTFEPDEKRRYGLRLGDLLVNEGGAGGAAEAAVWDGRISTCFYQKSLHRVRARSHVPVEWLMYWLRYAKSIGVFDADNNKATIPHLTGEKLAEARIPIPENGQRLAAALNSEIADIRETQRKMSAANVLLAERRQALITAAVTGQIDVSTAGRGVTG